MAEEKKQTDNASTGNNSEVKNSTDPQENMEGPISSMMQKVKETTEENDEKDKAEGKE